MQRWLDRLRRSVILFVTQPRILAPKLAFLSVLILAASLPFISSNAIYSLLVFLGLFILLYLSAILAVRYGGSTEGKEASLIEMEAADGRSSRVGVSLTVWIYFIILTAIGVVLLFGSALLFNIFVPLSPKDIYTGMSVDQLTNASPNGYYSFIDGQVISTLEGEAVSNGRLRVTYRVAPIVSNTANWNISHDAVSVWAVRTTEDVPPSWLSKRYHDGRLTNDRWEWAVANLAVADAVKQYGLIIGPQMVFLEWRPLSQMVRESEVFEDFYISIVIGVAVLYFAGCIISLVEVYRLTGKYRVLGNSISGDSDDDDAEREGSYLLERKPSSSSLRRY